VVYQILSISTGSSSQSKYVSKRSAFYYRLSHAKDKQPVLNQDFSTGNAEVPQIMNRTRIPSQ
jgi:hypothetical protein